MMLYAVNLKTKEHRVIGSALRVDEKVVEADDDGWIPWNGDRECPLPVGQPYQVIFAHEKKIRNNVPIECKPDKFDWCHSYSGGDIIAYRPILEESTSSGISRTLIMDSYMESQEGKETEWDGNGKPPVGCECEFMEIDDGEGFFSRTTVIARHGGVVWLSGNGLCEERKLTFRPVLSADEKAIDELASNILDTVNRDGIDFCHDEKVIAKRLYTMGYRKVEESYDTIQ